MHPKVNLSKGSPTKHFACSVELRLCFWCFISFLKRLFDCIRNLYNFSHSRTSWQTCFVWLLVLVSRNVVCNLFCWKFTDTEGLLCNVNRSLVRNFSRLRLANSCSHIRLRLHTANLEVIWIKHIVIYIKIILLILSLSWNISPLHHNLALLSSYLLFLYWQLVVDRCILTDYLVRAVVFVKITSATCASWRFLCFILHCWLVRESISLWYSDLSQIRSSASVLYHARSQSRLSHNSELTLVSALNYLTVVSALSVLHRCGWTSHWTVIAIRTATSADFSLKFPFRYLLCLVIHMTNLLDISWNYFLLVV